jgi:hypothetical protein
MSEWRKQMTATAKNTKWFARFIQTFASWKDEAAKRRNSARRNAKRTSVRIQRGRVCLISHAPHVGESKRKPRSASRSIKSPPI